MHVNLKQWVAVSATLLLLGGCGGSDKKSGPSGDPSVKASGDPVSRGVITNATANSITVNGVDYTTAGATITMDDPSDPAVLLPGMVVTVNGTSSDAIRGTATQVKMADNLKGPIASFNNLSSSLTVLGQRVRVDPTATVFSNFSGGFNGLNSTTARGQMVRVSGFLDQRGTVHATFIQHRPPDWTPATPVTVSGIVTSQPTSTSFTIGALTVNAAGTTIPSGTTVGSLVKVTGTVPAIDSTTLTATSVTLRPDLRSEGPAGTVATTQGYVTGLNGRTFTIDGTPVDAGNLALAGISNGSLVTVQGTLGSGGILATGVSPQSSAYQEISLVSNIPGLAVTTDPNLINPWGIARSPTGPWWVNDNGSGVATVYDSTGHPAPAGTPLVVAVPAVTGGTTPAPITGLVFNNFSGFNVTAGVRTTSARFIFATEDGTIVAWNSGTTATIKVNNFVAGGGAVYKGVTLANDAGRNLLYAANFRGGKIDVFDSNFAPVTLPSGAAGAPFTVPAPRNAPPAGYAPFNVANIGNRLYVTYAKLDTDTKLDDVPGQGHGFVEVFNPDGSFVMSLQNGLWLNSPWAVVQAPSDFGRFSNSILVGNFGSGQIAAFDPVTGNFLGLLRDTFDDPIVISGLWGLGFGNGGNAGGTNALFFSAGLNGESDGLFGTLKPATRIPQSP